jgi:hypothetical protein
MADNAEHEELIDYDEEEVSQSRLTGVDRLHCVALHFNPGLDWILGAGASDSIPMTMRHSLHPLNHSFPFRSTRMWQRRNLRQPMTEKKSRSEFTSTFEESMLTMTVQLPTLSMVPRLELRQLLQL